VGIAFKGSSIPCFLRSFFIRFILKSTTSQCVSYTISPNGVELFSSSFPLIFYELAQLLLEGEDLLLRNLAKIH
jgi:hypothetical protein